MKDVISPERKLRLKQIEAALARAGRRARRIAQQTGTPLVTYRDGKVVKERVPRHAK